MRRPERTKRPSAIRTTTLVALFAAIALSLLCVGCERRRERWSRNAESVESTPTSEASKAPSGERPPEIPGLTADAALRATVAAYSNAKFYADDAYFEIVCEFDDRGERRPLRVPCSFAFAKPNFVRMEVGSGVLWSDGETIRAEILDEARAGRRLELPAPMLLTSIKELYPDAELAEAMDLGVSPDVFWAPPQAILTLAKDPLRTLVPPGSRTRLLRPEYLRFVDPATGVATDVACDRVEIDAEGGIRVLWLDRATKGLVRFEFPIERFAAPDDVERVAELRLEFPNQILADAAPTDPARFREPPKRPNAPNVSTPPLFPSFEDETALAVASEAPEPPSVRVVDRFLPPELSALGRAFPPIRVRSLVSGFSDATLGRRDDGKKTVVCFWGSSTPDAPNVGNLSASALREFEQAARYNADDARLAFVAVDVDPPAKSDDAVRAEYGASGATGPLFRLDRNALRAFDFPTPSLPSIAILDERGVVQKYVREPVSFVRLQRLIVRALEGGDLYRDDFNAYYADVKRFVESLEAADANDRYYIASERREPSQASIPPRRYPKTFGLREVWRFDELCAPTNPLAVSASDADFDAARAFAPVADEENDDENKNNVANEEKSNARSADSKPNADAEEKKSSAASPETLVPLAVADSLPEDLVVVPCDGNALALLTASGRLVRKTTPAAAVGEPISFVRTVRYDGGKRLYVASSRLQSQKVHRFDKNFNDLGTLDVGKLQNQRIGDARFLDADGDGTPELALGLVGAPSQTTPTPHGLYVVASERPKILWKDENVLEPYRLGVRFRTNTTPRQTLLATTRSQGLVGSLVENDAATGERLGELRADAPGSFVWFATSDKTATGESNVVAILAEENPKGVYFVGLGADGSLLWRNPIDWDENARTERIVSGDLDGDGVDEWLVASTNGVVRFFRATGEPLDVFQFGEEISGVCVARWNDASYLIVADAEKVSAWRVEPRNRPRR
ncbi:MAG: hypothetical protein IKU86_11795 [Thermoguttaceae bacterium]|nr:hypothetical protein [Thermoguttaceae bacterium]